MPTASTAEKIALDFPASNSLIRSIDTIWNTVLNWQASSAVARGNEQALLTTHEDVAVWTSDAVVGQAPEPVKSLAANPACLKSSLSKVQVV